MKIRIIAGVILICMYGLTIVEGWDSKVPLEKVRALTLYRGKYTTGRRTEPIKQIKCVGGDAGCRYEPEVIQCRNIGLDGTDPNWKCEADLPNSLKFGRLKVTCEGYDFREDPYILKGSCGLEYTLYYTDDRKKKQWFDDLFDDEGNNSVDEENNKSMLLSTIFGIVWFGILGYILYNMYLACMRTRRPDNRPTNFPYQGFRPPDDGAGDVPYHNNDTTRGAHRGDNIPHPGFWRGALGGGLGGGLLGYLFGRRNNNNYRTRRNRTRRMREREPSSSYSTSSSYFTRNNNDDRYTAYGFAETDRR